MILLHRPQLHGVNSLPDGLARCIAPQIDDEGASAGLEDAVYFRKSLGRFAEILERGAAQDEVEARSQGAAWRKRCPGENPRARWLAAALARAMSTKVSLMSRPVTRIVAELG